MATSEDGAMHFRTHAVVSAMVTICRITVRNRLAAVKVVSCDVAISVKIAVTRILCKVLAAGSAQVWSTRRDIVGIYVPVVANAASIPARPKT